MDVVRLGLALQMCGVTAALGVLGLLQRAVGDDGDPAAFPFLLGGMVLCGVVEALGAMISSVAVKKDW